MRQVFYASKGGKYTLRVWQDENYRTHYEEQTNGKVSAGGYCPFETLEDVAARVVALASLDGITLIKSNAHSSHGMMP